MPFPTNPTQDDFVSLAVQSFQAQNIQETGDDYMTQLRKIFNEVLRTEEAMIKAPQDEKSLQRLDMLRPRIQYLCARTVKDPRQPGKLDRLWRDGAQSFAFSTQVPNWLSEVRTCVDPETRNKAMTRVRLALEAMVAFAKVKQSTH